MGALLRRPLLEAAVLVSVPATIVALALGSSWSTGVRAVAGPLKWALLLVLAGLAAAWALSRAPRRRLLSPPAVVAAAFLLVALASALWSTDPSLTAEKAASFAVLLGAAALLGVGSGGGGSLRPVLGAILVGAAVVALIGLGIYLVRPANAFLQTGANEIRFRGVGQNPNTVALLLAVVLPLALLLFAEARTATERALTGIGLALLVVSIVASASRGAIAAGVCGVLLFGLACVRERTAAVAAVGAVLALVVGGLTLTGVPSDLTRATWSSAGISPSGKPGPRDPHDADFAVRLDDEVGAPQDGSGSGAPKRSRFGTAGRPQAWKGAIQQGAHRPVAGYGFGTESRAFVDRYYGFQGGVPENSFIGMFLQLGSVGVALLLVLLGVLAGACVRAFRSAPDARAIAACGAVLLAAVVLALVQSYVYAAGNIAALAVWICAFLPAWQGE